MKCKVSILILLLFAKSAFSGIDDGLLAHYELDGNAFDSTNNFHDGLLFGTTVVADRFGNSGRALNFNGL